MKRLKHILSLFILLAILGGFLYSCDEDKNPRAVVTVVYNKLTDTGFVQIPVGNARVWFNPPENASQPDIVKYVKVPELTDIRGQAEFETNTEAIIELIAKGEDSTGTTKEGAGVIVLLKNETYYETIILE